LATVQSSPDLLVVGGGVIGLSVGWRAAQSGLEVEVLERGEPGGATSAVAAGMIAPIAEADPREQPLLALALQSARAYPQFVAELREQSGLDPGYLTCGTLMVARDGDEAATLERERRIRERLGLTVRSLAPSAARSLEPALAPLLRGALGLQDDCAIDPRALTRALAAALRSAGGRIRRAEVAELRVAGERVLGVRTSAGARIAAERVLVAAGPWSGALPGLPDFARVPIRPVKGQVLRLSDPSGPGLLTRVIRMQPGYLVPRGDGRYVLGASVEERGFDRQPTAGPIYELLRDAIELVPGVSELALEEISVGIRPGTPDNRPAIGAGALEGLFWATGHYRHGILLAPVTAKLALAALAGRPPCALAQALDPTRFAAEERRRSRGSAMVGA
jgi:glycine oxidase